MSLDPQSRRLSRTGLAALGLAVALSFGCAPDSKQAATTGNASGTASAATTTTSSVAAVNPDAYVHANELGYIPVMEYHRLGSTEQRWTRTYDNFRKDLEFFYNNGYHLVTMRDVAERHLDVPAGKKALVLTFDDATLEQFKYETTPDGKIKKDASGKPVIDPNCAVGILDAFYAQHPDFGRAATFYVLPSGFEQDAGIGDKLRYLLDTGREIGNHTWTHLDMAHASAATITSELSRLQAFVNQQLGKPYEIGTMALPDGLYPKTPATLAAAVSGGSGSGKYHNEAIMLVGANPSYSPYDKRYSANAVARIQAIDEEFHLWFNRKPGFTGKVTESRPPYVSDGDPNRVSFPIDWKKYFNPSALAAGQTANPVDPNKKVMTGAATGEQVAANASDAAAAQKKNTSATVVGSDEIPGYGVKLPVGGTYADGKLSYTVKAGDSVEDIAYKFVKFTDCYTYPELAKAIRAENHISDALSIGEKLTIPEARTAPPAPHMVPVGRAFVAKGIYVTGTTAGSNDVFKLAKDLKTHGGNTIVFDAKDMDGVLTYDSQVPLARQIHAYHGGMITDMPKFIDRLHQLGIHVVARMALFHDNTLAHARHDLNLRNKKTGGSWLELGQLDWVDPSMQAVQDYNIALAKELIADGVDEIQYDYVRFPAMGDTQDISYQQQATEKTHADVIAAWLKRAHDALSPSGVLLSADVYGVVAWSEPIDVTITGQDLTKMAPYLDAISPMLYPSHFYGNYEHYAYPPDHPHYFVNQGVKNVLKKTAGTGVAVRPWLQAFPFRIHHYGPDYVTTQLGAAQSANGQGWLLWNALNDYTVGFAGVDDWNKHPQDVASAP
ncbi:MAG TPA: putative glycoside hydrolase [Oscillatoriaceae cyanobacterium]